jgi:peptidoglycan L-alanyl-D-glutamate endopeptidase CwlK|tara:strand:+ start:132 stop:527 length:396 start_codon:yes stop_codon:yes gene_type:complete
MPKFGKRSMGRLNTCDEDLIALFQEVVKYFDCSVLEGHRGEEKQNKYFNEGKSKLKYPEGRHNKKPSNAVDVVPYPVDWEDREQMSYFAGFVKGVAYKMGIPIRWGGDWNNNNDLKDNNFDDLPHFELRSF